MTTQRYHHRKNLNIYWTVFDVATGQAVVIDGVVMDMLSAEEAEDLVDRLNGKGDEIEQQPRAE